MRSWAQIQQDWSSGWRGAWTLAQARWASLVERDPARGAREARPTLEALQQTRAELDAIRAVYPKLTQAEAARFQRLANEYHQLAAGVYAGAAGAPEVGIAPIVVLGVALSVAAVAWAIAAATYAASLLADTRLVRRELEERIRRTPEGQPLPDSTLPDRNAPLVSVGGGGVLLGVLGLGLVGAAAYAWTRSRP